MNAKELIGTLSERKNFRQWSKLGGTLTLDDCHLILEQAKILNFGRYEEIARNLVATAFDTVCRRSGEVREYLDGLPADWYREPFYYAYVQFFGPEKRESRGTFRSLTKMLPYLTYLGIRNLYLLPHYESPRWDQGYDVSDYLPAENLGGAGQYETFMEAVRKEGFRVVTDAVFNHTSIEHTWFRKALEGEKKYIGYYLRADGWKKIAETNIDGDIRVQYRDDENNFMERTLIFPDIARKHFIETEIEGKRHVFYSHFFPFQVDLDLQNPAVLGELWHIVGEELNSGILGKRTDAIAHWLKPKGAVDADGNPETFAMHTLLKSFIKLVSPKSIIIPEAVRTTEKTAKYLGYPTAIGNRATTTQGDATFNFHAQGALRETLCFCTSSAWWEYWRDHHMRTHIPAGSTWLNLLGHHDEIYLGFIRSGNRQHFRNYIQNHQGGPGGVVYKEGMSAGARTADCLLNNERRIAMAFFLLYMIPGVPAIYYGDEIAETSNIEHALRGQKKQKSILEKLGIRISADKAFDPRQLQRGAIEKRRFERAKGSLIVQVVRRLNELWKHPVVRSPHLHDIPCGDDGVMAMEKYLKGHEAGQQHPPLIALANLTDRTRVARLPLHGFHNSLHTRRGNAIEFMALVQTDLERRHRAFDLEGNDRIAVFMEPFEFMLLGKR